jgi:hypothetical protein
MRAERRGDAVAYERLHLPLMLRRLVRTPLAKVGLSEHEAEDVVQEILISLHAKRHTWDETRPLLPGLYTIHPLHVHRRRAPPAPRGVLAGGDHERGCSSRWLTFRTERLAPRDQAPLWKLVQRCPPPP